MTCAINNGLYVIDEANIEMPWALGKERDSGRYAPMVDDAFVARGRAMVERDKTTHR